MSKVYEAFLPYRDRYGMNQLTTTGTEGHVSQNGALFTMEYLICLMEDEETPWDVKAGEILRLVKVYQSLEVLPGLSRRTPDSTEGDSMDNNGSNLTFSAVFANRAFAKRMADQGRNVQCTGIDMVQDPERNSKYYLLARIITATQLIWRPWLWKSWFKSGFKPKYFWNNTRPDEFCLWGWYGRSPGFLGKVDMCAYGFTTPFRWLGVLVGQFVGCFQEKGDTDARKLPYVSWYFLTKATPWWERWFWKLAYKLWAYILIKQYGPEGMRAVYSIYYQDANHPIRKYSKPHF